MNWVELLVDISSTGAHILEPLHGITTKTITSCFHANTTFTTCVVSITRAALRRNGLAK